jgi:Domain of unknown function (DUF4169)
LANARLHGKLVCPRETTIMPADIVNLRQFRKQRARADKAQAAAENRAVFGQTKSAKQHAATEQARTEKALTDHKREPGEPT